MAINDCVLREDILVAHALTFEEIYQKIEKHGGLTHIANEYRAFADSIQVGIPGLAQYVIEHARRKWLKQAS